MAKFLDATGLATLWTKCKNTFALKSTAATLSQVYPVGSIYMSVNSTSPATLFGGTWEQLKNRFLIGAGGTYSNGATGGLTNHTPSGTVTVDKHTLTVNEIPSHRHEYLEALSGSQKVYTGESIGNTNTQMGLQNNTGSNSSNYKDNVRTSTTGGGQGHDHTATFTGTMQNTMPPYLAVYMWKRTA